MSNLNRLKVVDFTCGRYDSDDVNTDIPFTDNFEKTRTIQQANVVLGAYVNRNYKDMQNKADIDDIPTKLSELDNDVGYITDGDIPSKTSDLTNDGSDGEHPFITNQVNDLVNYTDTTTLNGELNTINNDITNIKSAIDYKSTEYLGNITVESIKSKNMCYISSSGLLTNSSGVVVSNSSFYNAVIDVSNINNVYVSGDFTLLGDNSLRVGLFNTYPTIGTTGTRVTLTANGSMNTSTSNYLLLSFSLASLVTLDQIKNSFMLEEGTTGTTYYPYQNFTPIENENNSDGDVVKFPDGTMIITQKVSVSSVPVATAWGNLYMTANAISSPNYPTSFISAPIITVNFASNTASAIAMYSDVPSTTNPGGTRLVRPTTSTGVSGTIFITSIGRWK